MNILNKLGLMTVAEHEAKAREAFKAGWRANAVGEDTHSRFYLDGCEQVDFEEYRSLGISLYLGSIEAGAEDAPETDWEAKFKRAATDLAAQAEEIAALKKQVIEWQDIALSQDEQIALLEAETLALRPDALLWRNARAKRAAAKS